MTGLGDLGRSVLILNGPKLHHKRNNQNTPSFPSAFIGNLESYKDSRPSIEALEGDGVGRSWASVLILNGPKLHHKRSNQNTPSFPSAFIGNLKSSKGSRPSIEALEGDVFWGTVFSILMLG